MASFLEPFYGGRLYPDNLCDGRYRIRRCSQCEFIYQQVILDDNGMQLLYQDWVDPVFEHMPDPVQTLPELCCCLNAEGVLYLRVAAGGDVAERLQQRGWSAQRDAIHPLEHINGFTRKTLMRLAATQGLQPIKMPLRLEWGSLRGGIRREIPDRWFSTQLMFRR